MSVTFLLAVGSWFWIALMFASWLLNLWVLTNPSKFGKKTVEIAKAPDAWWVYPSTIACILYAVWYKWGF